MVSRCARNLKPKNKSVYKYNEDKILQEVKDYVSDTYRAHYNSANGTQTLDLIESVGDAAAFCRSNILKYASRYDKKDLLEWTSRRSFIMLFFFITLTD